MIVITKYIFIILTLVFVFLLARNIFTLLFAMENYNIHKKRLEQLKFNNKKMVSEEEQTKDLIDKITRPAITYILPKLKVRDNDELRKDLELTGWDKYFNPMQFRAMNLTLKIIGVIAFILLMNISLVFAIVWFVALFFIFGFLFNNSLKEKKTQLFSEFPEFIRITQGYLTANVPFSKAVEKSLEYVGDSWRPLLQEFVINCDVKSIEEAIEELKNKVDIFEVKELLSLIRLNLDQGIDVKESFDRQAEKVRDMQLEVVSSKIAKRQMLAVALQGPLLITLIGAFGLESFSSMMSFSSM